MGVFLMIYKPLQLTFLVATILSLFICGCQTQSVKDPTTIRVAKKDWASISIKTDSSQPHLAFYNRIVLFDIDGKHVSPGRRLKIRSIDCFQDINECRLPPGPHTIGVRYYWSLQGNKIISKRTDSKSSCSVINFISLVMDGSSACMQSQDMLPECKTTLDFEATIQRSYYLKSIHKSALESPDEIQIIDTKTGNVVGHADCSWPYEILKSSLTKTTTNNNCVINMVINEPSILSSSLLWFIKLDNLLPNILYGGKYFSKTVPPGTHKLLFNGFSYYPLVGTTEYSFLGDTSANTEFTCEIGEIIYLSLEQKCSWSCKYLIRQLEGKEFKSTQAD